MNKKQTLKKTAALLLGLGLTVGATGCDFIVTDNQEDLKQVVATVNISGAMEKDEAYKEYADDVQKLINKGGLSTDIPKRDLIAYFINVGYTYVQSYGYTYKDTFNMLMDGLVERKILTQYAVAYYLKNGGEAVTADKCIEYVNAQIDEAEGKEKQLLKNHREVLTMQYFLAEGDVANAEKSEEYVEAVYNMKKSLNDSLDSAENSYITAATSDDHTHEETRTTPTNVNTEKEDYIPEAYDVYTGRNPLADCGAYEALDGSTATSRKKAYNNFLSNLQGYGLIKEGEDTSVFTELDYYYLELSSTLGQALITKYGEDLKEDAIASLDKAYVEAQYAKIKEAQGYSYTTDKTAFETALDGVSDDSFVLYGREGYGFVYNILIPFSASQEQAYSAAKNKGLTQDDLYRARNEILKDVQAKDLRSAWFCEEDAENYAYEVTAKDASAYYGATADSKGYLFFENNVTNGDKYQTLTQYAGKYAYNGTATLEDDEWTCTPNKLDVVKNDPQEKNFIDEFEGYIDYVLGAEKASGTYEADYFTKATYKDSNGVIDYSNFVYYSGSVAGIKDSKASDYFNKSSDAYKALSAVNELMFAYSTDTGCLNTYMGYAVSPYKTDFVGEFEYAAQMAVRGGAGTYVVAPSDYGWHIIYCSFAYPQGDVYGGYNHAEATGDSKVEGSFSNLFYESLKSTTASNYVTEAQNAVLTGYKSAAKYYTERYQDLLDLDKA